MSETLLDCPFCGGEAIMRERYINSMPRYIDADALKKTIKNMPNGYYGDLCAENGEAE
jgi:hypothetical protein